MNSYIDSVVSFFNGDENNKKERNMKVELDPDVFGALAFYSAILIAKVLFMSLLTAKMRFSKKIFTCSDNDVNDSKKPRVQVEDADIARVRRAHLNDLENILPFLITAILYCFTNPDIQTAKLLFVVFTGARFLHTFVYAIYPLPQPFRALAFFVGLAVNLYMLFKIGSQFSCSTFVNL